MGFMDKLGDVFNKATEKAGEAAAYASDKANVVAAQTKFKMEQQKLKGKIPTLYKELGEKVYIAMRDDLGHDVLTETVTDYTKQLNDINAEIVELDKKIEAVAQEFEEKVAEAAEAKEREKAAAAPVTEDVAEEIVEEVSEAKPAAEAVESVAEVTEVAPAVETVESVASKVEEI